jgi:hypothetical protein
MMHHLKHLHGMLKTGLAGALRHGAEHHPILVGGAAIVGVGELLRRLIAPSTSAPPAPPVKTGGAS